MLKQVIRQFNVKVKLKRAIMSQIVIDTYWLFVAQIVSDSFAGRDGLLAGDRWVNVDVTAAASAASDVWSIFSTSVHLAFYV